MDDKHALAALAVEYWKLLRGMERLLDLAPHDAKVRIVAQARYASTRLHTILSGAGLSVLSFEGKDYDLSVPAAAVNMQDFDSDDETIVMSTLEPAIISDMQIILMGKVVLARKEAHASRD